MSEKLNDKAVVTVITWQQAINECNRELGMRAKVYKTKISKNPSVRPQCEKQYRTLRAIRDYLVANCVDKNSELTWTD